MAMSGDFLMATDTAGPLVRAFQISHFAKVRVRLARGRQRFLLIGTAVRPALDMTPSAAEPLHHIVR